MGNLGVPELLIILLVVLVFFGAKKIPEMAQGLGKGIREFKKATREIDSDPDESQPASSKSKTIACAYCRSDIPRDSKFCPSCGKSLEPVTCAKCKTVNLIGTKFCSECGEKLV